MINLNPISIPVSSTPDLPPAVGSYYVYFQPDGTLVRMDWNSSVERLAFRVSTHEVELIENFNILQIPNNKTIQVDRASSTNLVVGKHIQITGSNPPENDGLYTISSITEVASNPLLLNESPESSDSSADKVNIELSPTNLNPNVFQFGEILVPIEVTINHSLLEPEIVTFKNLSTKEAGLSIKHLIDGATVTLQPELPVPGLIRVSVLG